MTVSILVQELIEVKIAAYRVGAPRIWALKLIIVIKKDTESNNNNSNIQFFLNL